MFSQNKCIFIIVNDSLYCRNPLLSGSYVLSSNILFLEAIRFCRSQSPIKRVLCSLPEESLLAGQLASQRRNPLLSGSYVLSMNAYQSALAAGYCRNPLLSGSYVLSVGALSRNNAVI